MRDHDGRIFLSVSDLMRFMGCSHATALDLAHMRGTGPEPQEDSEDAALLQKQGAAPEFTHVELRDGTRATLRLSDYAAYARRARARLEGFVADPPPTRPIPCADCGLCRWGDHCARSGRPRTACSISRTSAVNR